MTVKQLKEKIKDLPDDLDVMIEQTFDEFQLSLLETAEVKKTTFHDGGKLKASVNCLILTD